jgi:hypothetical protein
VQVNSKCKKLTQWDQTFHPCTDLGTMREESDENAESRSDGHQVGEGNRFSSRNDRSGDIFPKRRNN